MTATTLQSSKQAIDILLVEDDDDDVRLTKKALENHGFIDRIHRVEDGVEAIDFLCNKGAFENAVRPDLILLDLNMPRKSGHEVLKFIKEDKDLCRIPVVVLTTSDSDVDVVMSYSHQANGYMTKPVDMAKFRTLMDAFGRYWLDVVSLPSVNG